MQAQQRKKIYSKPGNGYQLCTLLCSIHCCEHNNSKVKNKRGKQLSLNTIPIVVARLQQNFSGRNADWHVLYYCAYALPS